MTVFGSKARPNARRQFIERKVVRPIQGFMALETAGGIVIVVAALLALAWANSPWDKAYFDLWHTHLAFDLHVAEIDSTLGHLVNDGLMVIFFFVVGLEIKRELVTGELRDPRTASLPIVAAIGGMVVPALIYTAFNAGGPGADGWAIPMATDIAFAIVVLGLLGARIPSPLKLFLLTLAIVDDLGAIVVIAVFYSEGIEVWWLLGALIVVLAILAARRIGLGNPLFYVIPAIVLWVCTLESGVHATLAGVALGLLTPARPVAGRRVLENLEHRLHPWSSLLVIPVFAIANAGIHLDVDAFERAASSEITWGIIAGLIVGKPLGIVAASLACLYLKLGRLPLGVSRTHLVGAGCLAGIGFTVSLFVSDLTFTGNTLTDAKVGIVAASLASGALGGAWLCGHARARDARSPEVASE